MTSEGNVNHPASLYTAHCQRLQTMSGMTSGDIAGVEAPAAGDDVRFNARSLHVLENLRKQSILFHATTHQVLQRLEAAVSKVQRGTQGVCSSPVPVRSATEGNQAAMGCRSRTSMAVAHCLPFASAEITEL